MLNTNKEEQKEISPDKGSRQSFSRLSSGLKKPQIADINYTKAAMNGAKRRKSEMKLLFSIIGTQSCTHRHVQDETTRTRTT